MEISPFWRFLAVLAVFAVLSFDNVRSEDDASSDDETFGEKLLGAIQVPANKAAIYAVEHVDYKTTKYMYEIYKECLQNCWQYVLSTDDLTSCISSNKDSCQSITTQTAKDLLIYYAQAKALQVTKNKLSSLLHLNRNSDDDDEDSDEESSLKQAIFNQGIKIAKSAVKAKATSMAIDAGKKAIKDAISK